MKIKIYQIDHDKDIKKVNFENYKNTMKLNGRIDPAIYKTVFDGNIDCKDLEEVYFKFNINHPAAHQGHSLSVSDIVEIEASSPLVGKIRFYSDIDKTSEVDYIDINKYNSAISDAKENDLYIEPVRLEGKNIPSIKNGFYFCDKFGFQQIKSFDTSKALSLQGIKMLVVEPHEPPYEALIEDEHKAWQRAVKGNYECIHAYSDGTFIIYNDDTKKDNMEGNRIVNNDIIAGTFLIAASDGQDGVKDLSDEHIEKYKKLFEKDEVYTQEEIEEDIHTNFISM